MKKIYTTLLIFLFSLTSLIGQDSIYVYRNGAVNSKYAVSQVDSLSFSASLDSIIFRKNGAVLSKLKISSVDSVSFMPPSPIGSFRDIDGNIYTTIKIGTQTWMAENLKTKRYRNGDNIPYVSNDASWSSLNTGAYCHYDNNPAHGVTYGSLYNWYAINDSRNIAPAGWRMPSTEDWMVLESFLISNGYNFDGSTTGNKIAKTLASKTLWRGSGGNGAPGNNPGANNSSKFNGLPAGGRYGSTGVFFSQSETAFWWAKEETSQIEANYRGMFYGYNFFQNFAASKNLGFTVRCIKSDLPSVSTFSVNSITIESAASGGNVSSDGKDPVTARGVCWNTSGNPSIINNKTTDWRGVGEFNSIITGLEPGTTYYLRAYATNGVGTAYGDEVIFKTLATSPTVITTQLSAITDVTATSGGNIITDGGASITARGVCWSTNQNPTIANSKTTNGTGSGEFISTISGLTAGTKYYVRAYATNEKGTSYGQQITFTTLNLPTLTTTEISDISASAAKTGGKITSNGGANITAKGVCWSTDGNPTTSSNISTDGAGSGDFSSLITGLNPGTVYYVRAYAINSVGTAYGNQIMFTSSDTIPDLTTNPVIDITAGSAISGGEIATDGGAYITAKGVCWSTSNNPTLTDSITTDGAGTGAFTSSLIGLKAATLYYVRAYATNSAGTAYGNIVTFTTSDTVPSLTTVPVTEITTNSAISGGVISTDGGAEITVKGVCWSTSPQPTIVANDNKTSDGNGKGEYSSSFSGLLPGTTYYLRSYATNSKGTAYGNEISFTTLSANP